MDLGLTPYIVSLNPKLKDIAENHLALAKAYPS
jgi:hypothetical protein